MLMLQRAATTVAPEECKDAAVVMACALDPESDACPAACRKDSSKTDDETPSDTTVKAGDLQVSVSPATDRRVTTTGVSDLDTITLRASEAITVNSITLERFGYSTYADVYQVWLEDAYGNKIADAKTLSSSKDNVTLKIKKEYRDITESDAITIVLETKGAKKGTIGFKVTDVDSSAKNLDLANYNPYTYEIVDYDASAVKVSVKGNEKTYNYEEETFYEVSRLKIKAGTGAVSINGLTLTNEGSVFMTWALPTSETADCAAKEWYTAKKTSSQCEYSKSLSVFDLDEFVKDVKVTADGKEVNGLKFRATKDNELVMSWDEIEVAINKDVQIVVSIAMENFDEFQKYARLVLKDAGDLNAIEKKTGARVTISAPDAKDPTWKEYKFAGSKIRFTNTKLSSTIDAAQGAEDVVIAKGNVTVGEEIKINDLVLTTTTTGVIDALTINFAGDSYDASVNTDKTQFTFKNINIEKSWEVEITVDIVDEEGVSGKEVNFKIGANSSATATSLTKSLFAGNNARYVDSREDVKEADVAGSVAISKVKVQESKANLKNSLSSSNIEFPKNETNRKTVFEGTYTAKKSDIYLNEFAIVDQNSIAKTIDSSNELTFYVSIDGTEVGDIEKDAIKHYTQSSGFDQYEDFSEVLVEAGKSVKVKVEVEASVDATSTDKYDYYLYLRGDDKNGTDAGFAKAAMNSIKFVLNGSVNVSDSTTLARKTVALNGSEVVLAKFILKPSKSNTTVTLDNLVFDVSAASGVTAANLIVEVDGSDLDTMESSKWYWTKLWEESDSESNSWNVKFDWEAIEIDNDWIEVEVKVRDYSVSYVNTEEIGADKAVKLTLASVNGVSKTNQYSRLILPAIVKFERQVSDGAFTTFTIWTDSDNNEEIQNLMFFTTKKTDTIPSDISSDTTSGFIAWTVTDWASFDVANSKDAQTVKTVYFEIKDGSNTYPVRLHDWDFNDFFKVEDDGKTLRVFQTKDN